MQEVVVGQRIHIIYDNQYVDWDELADVLEAFNQDIAINLLAAGQDPSQIFAKLHPYITAVEYIRHTMQLSKRY